jgi:hypothetical protein
MFGSSNGVQMSFVILNLFVIVADSIVSLQSSSFMTSSIPGPYRTTDQWNYELCMYVIWNVLVPDVGYDLCSFEMNPAFYLWSVQPTVDCYLSFFEVPSGRCLYNISSSLHHTLSISFPIHYLPLMPSFGNMQSDSKLLSGFPWPIIFKPEATE